MAGPTLVTGAAGFAGSHLLDLLADQPDVFAWHRPGGTPPASAPGVRWMPVDLLDRAAVMAAVVAIRPSTVYHCAGAAHVGVAWSDTVTPLAVNVRGTHHLLEALRYAGQGTRVLVTSSAMVYRPANHALSEDDPLVPVSPYGLSKLAQEMRAARAVADGIDMRIARAFNHTGPRQSAGFAAPAFARQIADIEAGRAAPEIAVGNLDAERDISDVRDTVRAYRLMAECGRTGCVYNVCAGRAVAIRRVLDLLLARARTAITVVVDPTRLRPNDVPLSLGDPRRLHDDLGWTPTIPLERTLDDLLEYWRTHSA